MPSRSIVTLPSELINSIYDHLDLPAVIRMSHVCSLCRTIARTHHTFWRDIRLYSVAEPDLEFFAARLESTTSCGLRIYLDISYVDASRPEAATVLCAVGRNLSRTVTLHLTLHPSVTLAPICQPAPLLETFRLDFRNEDATVPLPVNILGGHCPQLRVLELFDCTTPLQSMTAFTRAHRVAFATLHPQAVPTDLFSLFPALRDLEIESTSGIGDINHFCAQFQQPSQLDSLIVQIPGTDSCTLFARCPALLSIPTIVFRHNVPTLSLLTSHLPGPLGIELTPCGGHLAWYTIRSHSCGWKRTFTAYRAEYILTRSERDSWWPSAEFYQTTAIAHSVTTLSLTSTLARLSDRIGELPACEMLQITMDDIAAPGRTGTRPMSLPRLRRVTVCRTSSSPASFSAPSLGGFIRKLADTFVEPLTVQLVGVSLTGDLTRLAEYGLILDNAHPNAA
ncbi:hypothetical protein AURDEDRAFT_164571 [Auricularia subglabra TFB-10046 SS5]|nr:hypothetical protein AURDEDRAFT_164571 [Auricularia subglabra TFB-10046 SS5]